MEYSLNLPPEGLHHADRSLKWVYWTFDDGPHPDLTPRLLDFLEQYSLPAVLFFTGKRARQYPSIVKEAVRRGVPVGNHTWSHPRMERLNRDELFGEISRTQELLADLCGSEPLFFRQSFRKSSKWQIEICSQLNLFPLFGDCWAGDFKEGISVREIGVNIERDIQGGSILGFHEMYPVTLESLKSIVKIMQDQKLKAGDPLDLIPS